MGLNISLTSWRTIVLLSSMLMGFIGYYAFEVKDEYFSIIPMILLALPAYVDLLRISLKKGLILIGVLSAYATFIEALSIVTSFPYGSFNYNAQLGYKLFDLVPWAVSFGWVPLVIGVFALSTWIFKGRVLRFVAGTSILIWADLILDPGAVLMTFWTWNDPGYYYTIPVSNYLGWAFSSLIGGSTFYYILPDKVIQNLSVLSIMTLALGNAFWIGVTLSGDYWIPFFLAILLQIFMLYALGKKLN